METYILSIQSVFNGDGEVANLSFEKATKLYEEQIPPTDRKPNQAIICIELFKQEGQDAKGEPIKGALVRKWTSKEDGTPRLTFAQFQATRKEMTVTEYCEAWEVSEDDYYCQPVKVLYYFRGLPIEVLENGKYHLITERSELESADLTELEKILYEWADGDYFHADPKSRMELTTDMIDLPSLDAKMYSFSDQTYIDEVLLEDVPQSQLNQISVEDAELIWSTFKVDCGLL